MREYLTSNLLCPTSNVTEPIPTGLGQQGQECPEQLLMTLWECEPVPAAHQMVLVCTSEITEQRQDQLKEAKCCKKIKK